MMGQGHSFSPVWAHNDPNLGKMRLAGAEVAGVQRMQEKLFVGGGGRPHSKSYLTKVWTIDTLQFLFIDFALMERRFIGSPYYIAKHHHPSLSDFKYYSKDSRPGPRTYLLDLFWVTR